MVFSSVLFLFTFLPLVLLIYFLSPRRYRNLVLFICSLIFYAWGEPVYITLMLFSTIVDYTHGILVDRYLNIGRVGTAKLVVASSAIINLSLLGFFKYGDFLLQNINLLFGTKIPLLNLPLPIGISFYTFQTMSYTIDVYRRDARVQKNIIDFGAYVTLFPQLIAGPIVRYMDIDKELRERREGFDSFAYGVRRFILGLGKKVLLANNIGFIWQEISSRDISQLSIAMAWLGVFSFAMQIYFDFSGYSDMAIGLGSIFGFNFPENFNYPYISKSITEFWRRWHISLGTWFREYVYIPLGGNKKGFLCQLRNIALVWLLTGIWHGASWNFLLWGCYFGIILIMEKVFILRFLERLPSFIKNTYAMLLVLLGWVIFAFENYTEGIEYLKSLLGLFGNTSVDGGFIYYFYTNLFLIIVLVIGCTPIPSRIIKKLFAGLQKNIYLIYIIENLGLLIIFLLSVAFLVDSSYNPFLYFRF